MNPVLGLTVERPDSVEMSAWGVASLAGIQVNSFSILPQDKCPLYKPFGLVAPLSHL
jgi:hypothetical protein